MFSSTFVSCGLLTVDAELLEEYEFLIVFRTWSAFWNDLCLRVWNQKTFETNSLILFSLISSRYFDFGISHKRIPCKRWCVLQPWSVAACGRVRAACSRCKIVWAGLFQMIQVTTRIPKWPQFRKDMRTSQKISLKLIDICLKEVDGIR